LCSRRFIAAELNCPFFRVKSLDLAFLFCFLDTGRSGEKRRMPKFIRGWGMIGDKVAGLSGKTNFL
jgi:hypothetical protein